jgi:hypothetical protein
LVGSDATVIVRLPLLAANVRKFVERFQISTCIQAIKDKGTTVDIDADDSCAGIRMIINGIGYRVLIGAD